jgi:selenocysteine-specific elongation factor
MEVIVGTAGHIDHGKTALVKALTGVDADRLPEEKRRGITVDLGFADLTIDGIHFGFVDVPGHERFVKNMLAGASGIDVVLLVIEAGEGVMPQTREHFDICRLLGIKSGVIVLTKIDLVDKDTLDLAKMDAEELVKGSFLADAPVVCVSSATGEGIGELKEVLSKLAADLPSRRDQLVTQLPIDRSFSMKGFGAVVTGTLASGEISEGAELEILPQRRRVRVRGLQTHGRSVATASAGQRVAVNLGGVEHSDITRGMVLSEPGVFDPTQIFDTRIEVLPDAPRPLRSRQRVRIHLGTAEVLGRVLVLNESGEIEPGGSGLVQLRSESPVVTVPTGRFILRSYSPQLTIAGGCVIDTAAVRHRRRDIPAAAVRLNALLAAEDDISARVTLMINAAGHKGLTFAELQARTGLRPDILTAALSAAVASEQFTKAGERYIAAEEIARLSASVREVIERFHRREPLAKGISREAVREAACAHVPDDIFQFVLRTLESAGSVKMDKETIRLASHSAELSPDEAKASDLIRKRFSAAGLGVPRLDEVLSEAAGGTNLSQADVRKIFQRFLDSGEVVKVTDEFYFSRTAIDGLISLLGEHAARTADRLIDVPKFKEIAGISRKYAIPLLEYLDRTHVTARAGDKRLIL